MPAVSTRAVLYYSLPPSCVPASGFVCAGAVGLASALRGTVRQALESYQTRAALHRMSCHSRHSSTGSGTLGPLRSALGAAPVSAAGSPWQQQQQELQQQQSRRVSWAQLPLSPLGPAAIGVSTGGGLGRSGSTAAAAAAAGGGSISRLSSVAAGFQGQWVDAPGAAADSTGAAGSRGRLVLHTGTGQKSSRPALAATAAAPAELLEDRPGAEAARAVKTGGSGSSATAHVCRGSPGVGAASEAAAGGLGTIQAGANASAAAAVGDSRSSSGLFGPRISGALSERVSSASSWSDFDPVGDGAGPGSSQQQQQRESQ